MSQIRLVADSSCDLLSLDGVDFVSVPLTLRTETEEFRDDARLDVDAMVSTLRATKGRSYSACPNVADWEKAFGESGDVLAFTITSSLSGSYSAACVAKQSCEERDPSRRIRVVDTLSAGPETMLLLERAASAQRGGASFDEVYRVVEELQRHTHLLFSLESMHNLAQNGRISKLAATAADRRVRRERSRCSASAAVRGKRRNFYCRRWSGSATRAAACASGIAGTPRFRWSCIRSSAAAFPMPMCGGIRSGACAATMPSAAAS